jgi:riboflavin kinase/FMN adenylyltransferase
MTRIFEGVQSVEDPFKGCVAALGNFDGMHLGHQTLVRKTIALANRLGAPSMIFSFFPHPMQVLKPERSIRLICTPEQRLKLMTESGVDAVVIERFTNDFAKMTASDFVDSVLKSTLQVKGVVVGENFRFGNRAQGDASMLKGAFQKENVTVEVVEAVQVNGRVCSSSQIRDFVEAGDIRRAKEMLGRWFSIEGKVVKGDGRGRSIGIPTINLRTQNQLLPASGVYATFVRPLGEKTWWKGATNIGFRPTFDSELALRIETHLLDFTGDLYGQAMELFFVEKVRDEIKFSSVNDLVEQIHHDISRVKEILNHENFPLS